jgi:hypothetical protein
VDDLLVPGEVLDVVDEPVVVAERDLVGMIGRVVDEIVQPRLASAVTAGRSSIKVMDSPLLRNAISRNRFASVCQS